MGYTANLCELWGHCASANPAISILIGTAIAGLALCGYINYQDPSDVAPFWQSQEDNDRFKQDYYETEFGAYPRLVKLIMSPQDESPTNIFTKNYLQLLYYLQTAITTGTVSVGQSNYTLTDICTVPVEGLGCQISSPLAYYDNSLQELFAGLSPQQVVQCLPLSSDPDQLSDFQRICYDPQGQKINVFDVLGGITQNCTQDCSSCPVEASALFLTYLVNRNVYSSDIEARWETEVLETNIRSFNYATRSTSLQPGVAYNDTLVAQLRLYLDETPDLLPVKIEFTSEHTSKQELLTVGTQVIVIASLALGFAFVYLAVVTKRFSLSLLVLMLVFLASYSAKAVMYYWDIRVTSFAALLLPLLMLCVGIDNCVVLIDAESQITALVHKPEQRVKMAVKECGPAILLSVLCQIATLSVCASVQIQSLEKFCTMAAIAISFLFVYQMTIFLPFLLLDNKRIKDKRSDLVLGCRRTETDQNDLKWFKPKYERNFVPIMFTDHFKGAAWLITACLVVIGGMSFQKLPPGLNVENVLSPDSQLGAYQHVFQTYSEAGPEGFLVFANLTGTTADDLIQMQNIVTQLTLTNNKQILPVVDSWIPSFLMLINADGPWNSTCNSQQISVVNFNDQVHAFLQISIDSACCTVYGICGEQYAQDISFSSLDKVTATKVKFQFNQTDYERAYIDWLDSIAQLEQIWQKDNKTAFVYSYQLQYQDSYRQIRGKTTQFVLIAVATTLLIIQLTAHLKIAFLIAVTTVLQLVELTGIVWALDILFEKAHPVQANSFFTLNLAFSTLFITQLCLHIGWNFERQSGVTKQQRVMRTLFEIGASMVCGMVVVKLVAVSFFVLATNVMLKVYLFRVQLFSVLLATFNGLVMFPIVLAKFGPKRVSSHKQRRYDVAAAEYQAANDDLIQ